MMRSYTNSATVTLNVTANSMVDRYRWAQSEEALESTGYVAFAGNVNSYALLGGEGTHAVYMQFRQDITPS